jgi:serine/threonine-protein kinase
VGEVPEGDVADAQVFIAMAHYVGETFKQRIDRGWLAVPDALDIAIQTAQGLGKAHDAGIVHRDIKPANLIVTTDGLVKILDFGVAKLVNEVGLTQTGTTLGTVAYMSPEQAAGADVDRRSDLWALGVVLYEMLAGRTPFAGEGPQAVIHNLLNREPEPLTTVRSEVPASLDRVVQRALSKDVGQRYQHAAGGCRRRSPDGVDARSALRRGGTSHGGADSTQRAEASTRGGVSVGGPNRLGASRA